MVAHTCKLNKQRLKQEDDKVKAWKDSDNLGQWDGSWVTSINEQVNNLDLIPRTQIKVGEKALHKVL